MQTMEQSYVPMAVSPEPPEDEDKDEKQERLKVRVSLFYDGTQNNRANVNARKNVELGQRSGQTDAEYEESLRLFAKYGMKGSSYDNDESNVSRLEGKLMDEVDGYDHYFHIYTEGIGTVDKGKDAVFGLALAVGDTGIYAKVDVGISRALEKLEQKLPKKAVIEELALDTCGFSRGAAAARFAIHRALHDEEKGPVGLKTALEARGFTVEQVKVLAVGLFDTVSSYKLRHSKNVKELKLDAVSRAKAVLQLAAAEEYRENFALTNIESVGKSKGKTVYLPGSHSDVGGCYEDGMVEETDLYAGLATPDLAKFLLERGWYTSAQLRTELRPVDVHATLMKDYIRVKRSNLSKEYSFIPLHIMADFARKHGLGFDPEFDQSFKVSTTPSKDSGAAPIPAALVEEIKAYADSSTDSKPSDWEMPREDLNRLRNQHLHVPYSTGLGMGVNLAKSGSFLARSYRPHRKVYRG
jgi:hypothetical protein